jgi:hypothetical protein
MAGRRQAEARGWPAFDAPLLQDIATAFRSRSKSLRYRAGLCCCREFTEAADGAVERLVLDLRGGHVRLSVWADGWMWLSVCVRAPGRNRGWDFKDEFGGDVRDLSGQALVGMVEATVRLRLGSDPGTEREQLRAVWRRVGPRS